MTLAGQISSRSPNPGRGPRYGRPVTSADTPTAAALATDPALAVHDSVLDAIGHTPLIRLRRVTPGHGALVYVKAEFANPGGSVKDRAARAMVAAAEESGELAPGAHIVEATSGNTGIGLAMVAAQRGHHLHVVVPDKTSTDKLALLRAYGADVVVTPGNVPREHPDHVQNVARRIAAETGAWFADQYDNPANPGAHAATTGPEIWAQTNGRVTHFVAGVGTGGTITGAGGHLKRVSDGRVTVVGADPEQSVYSGGDGSPYYVESIGHYLHPETENDEWPRSYDTSVVDRFERISDRESIGVARRLAREEGLLVGGSAGTAVAAALRVAAELAPDDLVVVLLPDSGRSYLSKYFDDDWLRRLGLLEDVTDRPTVGGLVGTSGLPFLRADTTVGEAVAAPDGPWGGLRPVAVPRESSAPGPNVLEVTGTVDLAELRRAVAADPAAAARPVSAHARDPLPTVGRGEACEDAAARLGNAPAAWVLVDGRVAGIVSRDRLLAP